MQRPEGAGRNAGMNRLRLWSLLLAAVAVLNGCALFTLRKDNTFSQDSCLITGEVYAGEAVKRPILVVAFEKVDGRAEIAHYAMLHEPGPYELLVRKGRSMFLPFEDADRNLRLRSGRTGGDRPGRRPRPVHRRAGRRARADMAVVLFLRPGNRKIRRPAWCPPTFRPGAPQAGFAGRHSTQAGAPIDLNDSRLSAEEGVRGFWSPLEFFPGARRQTSILEEPYIPGREKRKKKKE